MDILNDDAIKAIGQYTGILYGPKAYTNFALSCKRTKNLLLPTESPNDVNNQTNIIIDNIIKARVSDSKDDKLRKPIIINTSIKAKYFNIRTLKQLYKYECDRYKLELRAMRKRVEAEALQQRRLDRERRREQELEKMRIRSKKKQEKLMLEEARHRSIREY